MSCPDDLTGSRHQPTPSRFWNWFQVGLVFVAFASYGTWRSPVPGVNEPHFLGKARHFWEPSWCARDLFLESSNTHWVFYATLGSTTPVLSFPQAAWVGRFLVWWSLAISWGALARQSATGRWGPSLSAAIFLGLSAVGNFSGEWLIGGVEAKGFAYAAVFLALALAMQRRPYWAAAACGIATSFHPVIGVWTIVALGGALLAPAVARHWVQRLGSANAGSAPVAGEPPGSESPRQVSAGTIVRGVAICLVCALPGLIPAVNVLLLDGTAPEVVQEANRLQVFERLKHHLDPTQFPARAWWLSGGLVVAWLALLWSGAASNSVWLFQRFVAATLLIAGAGLAIGFGPRWAGLMKFYPFRLADLFVPIAVSLLAADLLSRRTRFGLAAHPGGAWGTLVLRSLVVLWIVTWIVRSPPPDRSPTRWTTRQLSDWEDVCRWVSENTPADALCLTPTQRNYTFKWYAQRAEYVIYKDCPQDARSLVEWDRRMDEIAAWRKRHARSGITRTALAELRRTTGVEFVVDWYIQKYRVPPLYRNRSFRVYPTRE
ncbi:MAG: DUF6798 domain-containing protein [Planctomycetales bacterium]